MITRGVLAIDPGYGRKSGGCAVAYGTFTEILSVWFERRTDDLHDIAIVTDVVIEQPQQDGRSYGVPPAVLISLAWEGAAVGYRYAGHAGARVHEPTPTKWKGQEPKPAQHARLLKVLTPAELAVLGGTHTRDVVLATLDKGARDRWRKPGVEYYPSNFREHNLLDAVALHATFTGRLRRI